MQDVICTLLSTSYIQDSIGIQRPETIETECPIKKNESIYANEFYEANERGFKPTLRLRISSLNYNGEEELRYMGIIYTIIRVESQVDDTILVCQRKVKNVKNS